MRVDAHQHFWRYDPRRDSWITDDMAILRRDYLPPDLLPELAANGIESCVAVQADQSEQETAFLLDLAGRHKEILGVVGWLDLRAPDLPARLADWSRFPKLRGIRHIAQSEPDDRFLVREDFTRGIACLREFGLAYDILIYPEQLPAALALVEQFPGQRFVVDHLAKPQVRHWKSPADRAAWESAMRAIAHHPNVYCKISGMLTEADWRNWRAEDFRPYLDCVFEAFGAARVMFGSDWPVCLLAGTYAQAKNLAGDYAKQFSAAEQAQIFGLNAIRCYCLKASGKPPRESCLEKDSGELQSGRL